MLVKYRFLEGCGVMSGGEVIKRKLTETSRPVEAFMDEILKPRRPEVLYDASRHLILAGGKGSARF